MIEGIAVALVVIGLAFDLLGTIGLIRLPDVYNRLQAATKCVTLGTTAILAGVAVHAFAQNLNALGVKAIIAAVFILLTSPVAAHAVARAAHISGVQLWEGSVVDKYREEQNKQPPQPGR